MNVEHEALLAAGLTDYGARAYRALVRVGPSGASAIAEQGDVPPTKVYAVLADLERRGWVESDTGRPKTFRAQSPRDVVQREQVRLNALFDAAIPLLEADFREHRERHASPFWILHGAEKAAERSLDMVRHALKEVLLVAAFPLPGDEEALPRALQQAVRRGARVRLMVHDAEAASTTAFRRLGVEVRVTAMPFRFLAVDEKQVLIGYLVPQEAGGEAVTSIWHPSTEVARLLGSSVPRVWDAAEPVTDPA